MPRSQRTTRASSPETPTQVLEFWRMMELLSPQTLPQFKPPRMRSYGQVIDVPGRFALPWTLPDTSTPRFTVKGRPLIWQHVLYLGIYNYGDAYDILHRTFADDPDAYDQFGASRSACAAVCVSADGMLLPETAVLSQAAWAIGRVAAHGRGALAHLDASDQAAAQFTEALQAYHSSSEGPITAQNLDDLIALAQAHAGFAGSAAHLASDRKTRVESALRAADTEPTPTFFNSTIVSDIDAARDEFLTGHPGPALAAYLEPQPPEGHRTDVKRSPEVVDAGVTLGRLPLGRWPSNPRHPLALSQQFAVNQALNDLSQRPGILGVNGPPGTGKTTMLRDVLAGNVVERARRLNRLDRPSDGFTGTTFEWKSDNHPRRVTPLAPELTGFEMVVASANNAAVENITVEIPGSDAIDPRWQGRVDYFAEIASRLLGVKDPGATADTGTGAELGADATADTDAPAQDLADDEADAPTAAWGLIAAKLGRSAHRSAFMSQFWFGKVDGKADNVQTWLQSFEKGVQHPTDWGAARERFTAAERVVQRLLHEAETASLLPRRCHDCTIALQRAALTLEEAESELAQARHDLATIEAEFEAAHTQQAAAAAKAGEAQAKLEAHQKSRPTFWQTLFAWGTRRRWEQDNLPFREDLSVAQSNEREASSHLAAVSDARDHWTARRLHCEEHFAAQRSHYIALESELAAARDALANDIARFGLAHPEHLQRSVGTTHQLRAPWLHEALDEARSELFVEALHLHRAFFENTAKVMVNNLRAAQEVVGGQAPADLDAHKALAAWQSFFLVVPLVSTTFASLGPMFSHLGAESLGWLFIDEAGQANPQHAVGGIWRAQRVLAVGDPLQLPPIVSMPSKAQRDIAASYGVSETWLAPGASVQVLADRMTPVGTQLGGSDGPWVGAPLRVHRRCDDPMFSISNEIAYDGMMVNGVIRSGGATDVYSIENPAALASSHWADEPNPASGVTLQPSEMRRFGSCLAYLFRQGVAAEEIIAISPFRAVADAIRQVTSKGEVPESPEVADPEQWRDWLRGVRAGTIHTAQGREADVVILVLGGDPSKPGAKRWAAQAPNLVNVAVSRAKRRLYVIGDEGRWREQPYFRELSNALRPEALATLSEPHSNSVKPPS